MAEDRAARRREEIIQTAYRLFSERGYHATNISHIARALGLGHGTVYRYFKNKQDIFQQVVNRAIRKLSQVVLSEDPRAANTLEEYRAQSERIGNKLMDVFVEDEYLSKLLFYEALGVDPTVNGIMEAALESLTSLTEMYLGNGVAKGFLAQDLNTRDTAAAINFMILGALRDVSKAKDKEQAKADKMEAILRLMLRGMV